MRKSGGVRVFRGLRSAPARAGRIFQQKNTCTLKILAPSLASSNLPLIHPEMMREFVPNSFCHYIADVLVILGSSIFDRYLIERDSIRHRHAYTIVLAALGKWNSLVQSE